MKQEIDTGDILLQVKIPIGADETAGELHDRMKIAGGELLVRTLQGLADGNSVAPMGISILKRCSSKEKRKLRLKSFSAVFVLREINNSFSERTFPDL